MVFPNNISRNGSELVGASQWTLQPSETALSCVAMITICVVAQLANLGIVYYEKVVPDTHRTLLNKLASLASLYKVCLATVTFPVITVRLLIGQGLGETVCQVQNFLFMVGLTQLVLAYNKLIVLQYVYVCKLGAVGMIKEELVMQCVFWINPFLGSFVGLVHMMTIRSSDYLYQSFCVNSRLSAIPGKLKSKFN